MMILNKMVWANDNTAKAQKYDGRYKAGDEDAGLYAESLIL